MIRETRCWPYLGHMREGPLVRKASNKRSLSDTNSEGLQNSDLTTELMKLHDI